MTIATATKTHKSLIGTTTTTTTIITTTMTPPLPHRVDIAKKRKGHKKNQNTIKNIVVKRDKSKNKVKQNQTKSQKHSC